MEIVPPPTGAVAVLLRSPRLGQVKRRLAAGLGAEAALEIYQRLLAGTLDVLAPWRRVLLCITPDDAVRDLEALRRPGWELVPQGSGDLGARLHRMFLHAGSLHAGPWLAIGTDCPELTRTDLEYGWRALAASDVVLGPAGDGGYWMIGLRAPQPELFRDIPWGGPMVLRQTVARAAGLGLCVTTLRVLRDVDTDDDWRALRHRGFLAPD